ncbi:MAG: hypothetical protein ACKOET_18815 [Verrucomicrobiota bacterium]
MKVSLALSRLAGLLAATSVWAQTSQFLFQDSITGLANGVYDFEFRLFSVSSAGSQLGSTLTAGDIPVTNGLYSVLLDFGTAQWTGQDRWIEVRQRLGTSTGAYTVVPSREQVRPTPYAISFISGTIRNPTSSAPPAPIRSPFP